MNTRHVAGVLPFFPAVFSVKLKTNKSQEHFAACILAHLRLALFP